VVQEKKVIELKTLRESLMKASNIISLQKFPKKHFKAIWNLVIMKRLWGVYSVVTYSYRYCLSTD
jgi:hypothetical protein